MIKSVVKNIIASRESSIEITLVDIKDCIERKDYIGLSSKTVRLLELSNQLQGILTVIQAHGYSSIQHIQKMH